ncbi:hypothetical protein MVEN_01326700 [Mycena venus]|uniref:Uncharacterized protein n=1 Tax=Mycena venus TaxID=2733690 RepID=A0A8H7CWT6_9AGAR|nr:hypothetical protein MVEN_01326700 [Mycena venus]
MAASIPYLHLRHLVFRLLLDFHLRLFDLLLASLSFNPVAPYTFSTALGIPPLTLSRTPFPPSARRAHAIPAGVRADVRGGAGEEVGEGGDEEGRQEEETDGESAVAGEDGAGEEGDGGVPGTSHHSSSLSVAFALNLAVLARPRHPSALAPPHSPVAPNPLVKFQKTSSAVSAAPAHHARALVWPPTHPGLPHILAPPVFAGRHLYCIRLVQLYTLQRTPHSPAPARPYLVRATSFALVEL